LSRWRQQYGTGAGEPLPPTEAAEPRRCRREVEILRQERDFLKQATASGPGPPPRGVLHHADRGMHYTGTSSQRRLAAHGGIASMSRRGDCWDTAVVESFFATLTTELVADAT
jgi:transposase InsO family protein